MSGAKRPLSVGVLVLSYETWDIALHALNAAILLDSAAIEEFVLFDDGSPTPPPLGIDTRIRVIFGDVNRGYTRALKLAFAEMKSDLIVVFDADARPLAPFGARLRERFESDQRLAQLAFFAEDESGSRTGSFLSREPDKWSLLLGQKVHRWISRETDDESQLCVFSCCMATRRAAYLDVGGIDENFDFLDADLDYSMRLRRNGWRVATDPSLKALHAGGAWSQLQRHRVLRFYKSRWYLLRKHDLIPSVRWARAFILTRLHLERTLLKLFGAFLFRDSKLLSEKILGRRDLISYCRQHYR